MATSTEPTAPTNLTAEALRRLGGSFTGNSEWLDRKLPAPGDRTLSQACDLLRLAIGDAPEVQRLLSDVHLMASNEINHHKERTETAELQGRWARAAYGRVQRLLFDHHGKKTLRADDVRAALALTRDECPDAPAVSDVT